MYQSLIKKVDVARHVYCSGNHRASSFQRTPLESEFYLSLACIASGLCFKSSNGTGSLLVSRGSSWCPYVVCVSRRQSNHCRCQWHRVGIRESGGGISCRRLIVGVKRRQSTPCCSRPLMDVLRCRKTALSRVASFPHTTSPASKQSFPYTCSHAYINVVVVN